MMIREVCGWQQPQMLTWILCLRRGYRANVSTEKRISAKTDMFAGRREARTTEAATAAFIERTEESLRRI